jgi:hypothetical protein
MWLRFKPPDFPEVYGMLIGGCPVLQLVATNFLHDLHQPDFERFGPFVVTATHLPFLRGIASRRQGRPADTLAESLNAQ